MPEPESKHGAGGPGAGEWALGDAASQLQKSVGDVAVKIGKLVKVIWGRTSRRIRMVCGFTTFM